MVLTHALTHPKLRKIFRVHCIWNGVEKRDYICIIILNNFLFSLFSIISSFFMHVYYLHLWIQFFFSFISISLQLYFVVHLQFYIYCIYSLFSALPFQLISKTMKLKSYNAICSNFLLKSPLSKSNTKKKHLCCMKQKRTNESEWNKQKKNDDDDDASQHAGYCCCNITVLCTIAHFDFRKTLQRITRIACVLF